MSTETIPALATATRRRFLKRALRWGTAAAAASAAATAAYGFFNPQPNNSAAVRFPNGVCGHGASRRYLVTYASEFGTTGEVAENIATTLCSAGAHVDTRRIRDVVDLGSYDAVIIGGAIQFDTWMSEARHFVDDNEIALAAIPVGYFFTCLTLADPNPDAPTKATNYAQKLSDLSNQINPVSIGQFGGVLDYSRMNLPTLISSKAAYTVAGVTEGDYRNWDAIRTWTDALNDQLQQH